ncbi:transporter, partial [Oenococcus oeni]
MLNAYKKYWKNYFNFKDSSSRSDYWWLILANVIIFTILLIFSIIAIIAVFPSFLEAISGSSIASKSSSNSSSVWIFGSLLIAVILFVFANIIPAISLGVRRVRD